MPVQRVRKAYEQVADQIRDMIRAGDIATDERLPSEAALAADFGVSRPTIREALRVLSTENLIRTAKGSQGGSFVTVPTLEHITSSLDANINMLTAASDLTLEEFLEMREMLEVPAARLAAVRRDEQMLAQLRATIPRDPAALGPTELFSSNRGFHTLVVQAAGNRLLSLAAKPVFTVLLTHLERSKPDDDFLECVNRDHRGILVALESGDSDAAAHAMHDHLAYLREMYERIWTHERRTPAFSSLERADAAGD